MARTGVPSESLSSPIEAFEAETLRGPSTLSETASLSLAPPLCSPGSTSWLPTRTASTSSDGLLLLVSRPQQTAPGPPESVFEVVYVD